MKAIIFDMDGVIFDSEQIYYDACFMAAERNGLEFSHEFVKQFAGKTSETCQIILQSHLQDSDLVEQLWNDWGAARNEILQSRGVPLKTGVENLFSVLADCDVDLALVTSANRDTVAENFAISGSDIIDHFDHIVTVDDVVNPKPHPEPYLLAASLLGHKPTECIVVEDSLTGVSAALEAGANTIMINDIELADIALAEQLLFKADSHAEIIDFLTNHGVINEWWQQHLFSTQSWFINACR